MALEILLVFAAVSVGSLANYLILRLIYGHNLTMKIFLGLLPGILIILIAAYLWKGLGGVHELTVTFTLVPAAAIAFAINLVIVGKILIGAINKITTELGQGADQVTEASHQVASAGQNLAESSTRQASSLEETSSSLEEMSAMAKHSVESAHQAQSLTQEAKGTAIKASTTMSQLKTSMEKIDAASDETAKIIKSIDEIAFQTNLLALNAAVEAARAGEAGAGFAVVADEVRNLAMRAAEAARETQNLIEENIHNIKEGTGLVAAVDDAFSEMSQRAAKVRGLVDEMANASEEQSQGINQINQAANEMDKVTQDLAANAEESAASASELNSQAENLKSLVRALARLVGSSNSNGTARKALNPAMERAKVEKAQARLTYEASLKQGESKPAAKKKKPEEAIPLEHDDFADF